MSDLLQLWEFCKKAGYDCLKNEPMAKHTSFKIGGPAEIFIRPKDGREAEKILSEARRLHLPVTIIGKGSDLLVADAGIRGAVLCLDEGVAKPALEGETVLCCPAGASLTALCIFAMQHSLTGLEFAYGIPGSVGGAVCMNAGAYGGEMKDVLIAAEFISPSGEIQTLESGALDLSYRHSYFTDHPGCLVTQARLQLQKGDMAAIRARMDELMNRRKCKQPLEYPSAGSTFKRPANGYASELIDRCGLKGRRVGGAMVSEKHAGFLINYGGATCADMRALVALVQTEVLEKTGCMLECEIKLLGEQA